MDHEAIALRLGGMPPVEFSIDPANAFVLVALMQLALRHPALTDPLAAVGLEVVHGIREQMPEDLRELIDRGFHPDNDSLVTGGPA